MVNLGDKVKDSVTGFTGIAIGRTTWLHGCDRIMVQPEGLTKDGKKFEPESFDEPQLIVMTVRKVKEGTHKTGGFDLKPRQKSHPMK